MHKVQIEMRIAEALQVQQRQVAAAIALLDGGATVPFIARYRKEVTGGLDDTQLRTLEERLRYLRELESRRTAILKSIREQEKLTPALEKSLMQAETMARLEDLYLPFKPKRRTKAQLAREAGLEPLAMSLLNHPQKEPAAEAETFVDAEKGVMNNEQALEGARQILMEYFGEDADLVGRLRDYLNQHAWVHSAVVKKRAEEGVKFSDYFQFQELLKKIPSHRALAIFRGKQEGFLTYKMVEDSESEMREGFGPCEQAIARHFAIANKNRAADSWLLETVTQAWKSKIFSRLETELFTQLRQKAEEEAIKVFANNLRDLLLAAPAGQRTTMGLDPGMRTGVKVAVVDPTGKLLETATIYPHAPANRWQEALAALAVLADKHHVDLVSIGNGTGSRETEKLVKELREQFPQLHLTQVMVSEAGASVYSASELAAKEFPLLDVTLRGAVSIARRLQDPLAELVKIEPKAIGVGQYQHDLNQTHLARSLDAVIEDCVNHVGVDVNTASSALLTHIAGLSKSVAENFIRYRDEKGVFRNRQQFLKVQGVGPKSFEQAAGFLRIMHGDNPLDASAVHPEAYPLVEKIAQSTATPLAQIMGNRAFVEQIQASDFADSQFGDMTVRDVLLELEKPGRDPRPEFRTAKFKSGVHELRDLREGMILEGVVTNVANFGAFVDIGVHQDGLVHISALTHKFVDDPRSVVKTGDVVTVKVLEADAKRKRISLTMRLQDAGASEPERAAKTRDNPSSHRQKRSPSTPNKKQRTHENNSLEKKTPADPLNQVKKQLDKQKNQPQNAFAAAFAKAMEKD
ncbi:MAG: RNA-binding transcriptional accessory protein [Zetaproteobacteria bacterium]|nr:RNA-binding transcriptional accessory protein [Zetaproteobacteria bacterium]